MMDSTIAMPETKHPGPMTILRQDRGFTLIEALVLVVVMVILFLSLYIGIIYAEKTLATNYRDRVVMLLLTGELEMEYYRHANGRPFQLQYAKDYVIDELGKGKTVRGKMTITAQSGREISNLHNLEFVAVTAAMSWIDPINKQLRSRSMREEYFCCEGEIYCF